MGAVVTSINITTGDLVLDWAAPEDNGSPVTRYQIEIRDKVGSAFLSHASCDGTDAAIVAATECSVPMLTLTSAPYSYTLGDLIVVRSAAYNEKGFGLIGPDNVAGGTAKTVPAAPAPVFRGDATTPAQVQVNWTTLATTSETGGLPILSYHLAYDAGSGEAAGGPSWVDLVGYPSDSLLLAYTASGTAIVGGRAYVFTVRARNAIGWGAASATTTVVASSAPAQMTTVQTTIDVGVDPKAVKISWSAPADNSDPITEYQILIRKTGGTEYAEELVHCDGANATVAAARQCYIPLTTLRAPVFNLGYGELVAARARARNSLGYGQYSQPNVIGALIQTEPTQVPAPTMTGTSLSFVAIAWSSLTGDDTGGSAIESYHAQYA